MEAAQTLENLEPADIIFSDSAAKKVSDLMRTKFEVTRRAKITN
jgi:hypothetical protein